MFGAVVTNCVCHCVLAMLMAPSSSSAAGAASRAAQPQAAPGSPFPVCASGAWTCPGPATLVLNKK